MKTITALAVAAMLATAGSAFAQTSPTPPAAPKTAAPAASTPMDPAVEAKFKALDKENKGVLEGAALDSLKPVMTQVDSNKDGKVSRDEYAAGVKAGVIR